MIILVWFGVNDDRMIDVRILRELYIRFDGFGFRWIGSAVVRKPGIAREQMDV
jgi:hypothetical protein